MSGRVAARDTRGRHLPARARHLLAWLAAAGSLLALRPLTHRAALPIGTTGLVLLSPAWLSLLALAPLFAARLATSQSGLPRAQRWLAMGIRALLLGVLVLALCQPARHAPVRSVCAIALVDVSASMPDAALEEARRFVEGLRAALGSGDTLQLVRFAARPERVEVPLSGPIPPLSRAGPDEAAASDLGAAVRLASGLCPAGSAARAILISDGQETRGDVLGAAEAAPGLRIDVWRPHGGVGDEVAVGGLEAPTEVKVGEPFIVEALVRVERAARADLRLTIDGAPSALEPLRTVSLAAGETRVRFRARLDAPGPALLRAVVENAASLGGPPLADRFRRNDEAVTIVFARGRPRVLFWEGDPAAGTPLARALSRERFEVERGPLPTSDGALAHTDLVVLSDVAADVLGTARMAILERFVRAGGGLLFAAGPNVQGEDGYASTPLEELLPVRFELERKRERRRLALVLAIDRSGSMQGEKLALAQEAAGASAELLAPDDLLGVIPFDVLAQPLSRLVRAADRARLLDELAHLRAGGGTAILPPLQEAHALLSPAPAAIKHVILLTDGEASYAGIAEQCERMVREGITISAVGVGAGADKTLLGTIAARGGGRFYFTNDPDDVPQIFVRDTTEVARPPITEAATRVRAPRPARVLSGIDFTVAPPLAGFVVARARPTAEQVLVSERGEPMLARARVGQGQVWAWMSDVKNRWAAEWLRWPGYARLFTQVARAAMRAQAVDPDEGRASAAISIESISDQRARVRVDVLDPDGRFVDGLDGSLAVGDPVPDRALMQAREVPLVQTAPGRYEAVVQADRPGPFLLRATHRAPDGAIVATGRAIWSAPWPAEYDPRPDGAGEVLLRRISARTGGQLDPAPQAVLHADGPTGQRTQDLRGHFELIAIALLVVDVLARRLPARRARLGRPTWNARA